MSYIISDESGTCGALPRRDSWGTRLTLDHWTAQVEPVERPFPRYTASGRKPNRRCHPSRPARRRKDAA